MPWSVFDIYELNSIYFFLFFFFSYVHLNYTLMWREKKTEIILYTLLITNNSKKHPTIICHSPICPSAHRHLTLKLMRQWRLKTRHAAEILQVTSPWKKLFVRTVGAINRNCNSRWAIPSGNKLYISNENWKLILIPN